DLNVAYLYPNPASNILNIVSENKQSTPDSYTLINILGQIIKSKKIERKEEKKIKDLVKPKQKLLVQVQKDSNDKKVFIF
ncbi:MAG TPA: T9SS type A sorting domain-containing protein, partial [Flavobacterium sp.]|nr:T9SS type A sorting domain-containing protein [Flavobacterium sp.]